MAIITLYDVINFLRNCTNDHFEMVFEEMLRLENENYPYYKGTACIKKYFEAMKESENK